MSKYVSKILISAINDYYFFFEEKNFDIRDIGGYYVATAGIDCQSFCLLGTYNHDLV